MYVCVFYSIVDVHLLVPRQADGVTVEALTAVDVTDRPYDTLIRSVS